MRMFFDRAQKENREGPKEAPYDQKHAHGPLRLGVSGDEILRLFRHVRVPDEHVLAEADVGPENTAGQHPFPNDVVMLQRHDLLEITGTTKNDYYEHEKPH